MCKTGQAQRLFSLPISGMEGYIEDELDLRARTADPLASPFYHKVLYSWLIMRQDYRKGEFAFQSLASHLVAKQPRCCSCAHHVPIRGTGQKSHRQKPG